MVDFRMTITPKKDYTKYVIFGSSWQLHSYFIFWLHNYIPISVFLSFSSFFQHLLYNYYNLWLLNFLRYTKFETQTQKKRKVENWTRHTVWRVAQLNHGINNLQHRHFQFSTFNFQLNALSHSAGTKTLQLLRLGFQIQFHHFAIFINDECTQRFNGLGSG